LANEKLRTNQAQVEEKDKTIEKLLEQLKNMTEMKKEHEELLLTKFQLLLNTKKARIRELDQKLANNTSNEPKSDGEEPNSTLEPAQNRSKGNAKNVSSSTLEPMHTQPKGRRKATVREPAASTHVRRKHKPIPLSSGSEDDGVFITAGKMDIDNDESPKRTLRTTRIENKLPEKRPPPSPTTDDCATSSDVGEAQTSDHKDSEDEELPPVRKPPVIRPSKATVPKPGAWSATTASAGIGNTARAADEFDDDDDDDEL
jgi:myosin heavy subunit